MEPVADLMILISTALVMTAQTSNLNIPIILEETRDNGLSNLLIQGACDLFREIEEDLPALTSEHRDVRTSEHW